MTVTLTDTNLTPAVLKELDGLSLERLGQMYGPGRTVTEYAPTHSNWIPGTGRPVLTFEDDPAAAQAVGRCAANRNRYRAIVGGPSIHPARCGWCDYPLDVLLAALDHAAFHSGYVVTEYVVWKGKDSSYARPTGRAGTYENPRWAAFFAQDVALRARAIEHAADREGTPA